MIPFLYIGTEKCGDENYKGRTFYFLAAVCASEEIENLFKCLVE